MNSIFWVALAVFVITDVVVIGYVIRRLRPLLSAMGIPDANRRRELFTSTETLVADHLRANYSGDPAQLGAAMNTLLPQLRGLWQSHGVDLDAGSYKTIIEMIATKRGLANRKDLRSALATVS